MYISTLAWLQHQWLGLLPLSCWPLTSWVVQTTSSSAWSQLPVSNINQRDRFYVFQTTMVKESCVHKTSCCWLKHSLVREIKYYTTNESANRCGKYGEQAGTQTFFNDILFKWCWTTARSENEKAPLSCFLHHKMWMMHMRCVYVWLRWLLTHHCDSVHDSVEALSSKWGLN